MRNWYFAAPRTWFRAASFVPETHCSNIRYRKVCRALGFENVTNIKDVAKRAGVSIATVSRALSDPDKLATRTRERVIAAINELNYRPNSHALSLRSRKSNTIIVMVPDLANPFFSNVLAGIEKVAAANRYSMLLADTHDDISIERQCVQQLSAKRVDGIVQLGARTAEELLDGRPGSEIPFIHAIESSAPTECPTVAIDNVRAAHDIASHLVSLGHKKIGIIAGPKDSAITGFRLTGYFEALKAGGIDPESVPCEYGTFHLASGEAAAATLLLQARPKLTALICMSDELAMGAIKGAHDIGMSVPDDLSVVGFDNIPASAYYIPPLTTVTQPAKKVGVLSMTILLAMLNGDDIPKNHNTLYADLVVRRSAQKLGE